MKVPRITDTLPEVNPTLLWGNIITQHRRNLTTEIAPSGLLKKGAKREPPNKLLKIQGRHKKDVINEGTSQ
jgi:hypothetical protein